MVRLLAFCLASLAAASSVLGKRLRDGDYYVSIPGTLGPLYLSLSEANGEAVFQPVLPALGEPQVWNVNSDLDPFNGINREMTTMIGDVKVTLGYASSAPGAILQGSAEFTTLNLDGVSGTTETEYFVYPAANPDVVVTGDTPLPALSTTAYLGPRSDSRPPLTFTKVSNGGS